MLLRKLLREVGLTATIYMVLAGGAWWIVSQGWLVGPVIDALLTVAVMGLGGAAAVVFHRIPPGPDNFLIRLGLAAICRIVLPLGILLFLGYTRDPQLNLTDQAPLVLTAYLVSIVVTVVQALQIEEKSSDAGQS